MVQLDAGNATWLLKVSRRDGSCRQTPPSCVQNTGASRSEKKSRPHKYPTSIGSQASSLFQNKPDLYSLLKMASCLRLASLNAPRSSASIRASLQKANWLTRSVHRARGLPYDPKQGLGKFLSPPALETLVEYQEGLLERLNGELRSTSPH